ncbi:MFS transporter [Acidisphaera sp. L21]|uniref:MFS transporter n=1 Tax=Acidisphaera sp. L21 TaxID=1641851 RepID=UPI00131CCB75|nr:MFS transporter [Acidisphaera sp. L21]
MTSIHTQDTDGVAPAQFAWAVIAVAIGLVMAVLDSAIANIALPTIARDLQVTDAQSIWVVNSYQLAVTMSLLPLASLGEVFGYRRVHIFGLVLFVVASLLCALSGSLAVLTVSRVLQGLGAAGMLSVNVALIRFIFPRRRLGSGIAMNAMVGSVATAVGPTIASAILSVAHWPWLFAVNVPIGLFALLAAWRALPQTATTSSYDAISAVLSAATFGLFISGLDGLAHGQQPVLVAAELIGTAVIGTLLIRRQMTITSPMLPVDLLRLPLFALSVASAVACFVAQGAAYVAMPFLLQNTLGFSQVSTGFLLTPWPLGVVVISPLAGRLADRYPAAILGGIGLAAMAAGVFLMATLPAHSSDFAIIWRTAVCGIGFGFFNAPNNRAMIDATPPHRSGSASGLLATGRILGQTIGAALVAMCFEITPAHGATLALLVGAGFAAFAALASLMRIAAPSEV